MRKNEGKRRVRRGRRRDKEEEETRRKEGRGGRKDGEEGRTRRVNNCKSLKK